MSCLEPRTRDQWQEAVNLAEVCLLIDSGRKYGLLTGGPEVNVERCLEILRGGKARGIVPEQQAIDRILVQMTRGT